ncbi:MULTISPECIES: hypothetical protein [Gammaproteobacteria]|uniref:hypothetical protein n=1 Tax=Stenotrophomonas bentonitica TaxID=1450134 RepID=UPI00242ACB41|nr:hypothetical protein [Pseudomonas corrugata]
MATHSRSVVWVDHRQDAVLYSLRHLHPTYVVFKGASKGQRSALHIRVRVEYSHHCFSQDPSKLGSYDPGHVYTWAVRPDDPRVFCLRRWEASKALPGILASLVERNCYSTRRRNHFAVKRHLSSGHYVIYFRVEKKVTGGADLRLFVESAYHRDDMDTVLATAEKISILDILLRA